MDIILVPVKNTEKDQLDDLLREYELELTGEPERYKYLDSYFDDATRHPYFIQYKKKVVGCILINSYTIIADQALSISEFYVQKEYRRKGIGEISAKKAFELHPGNWEIREMQTNLPGQHFWRSVIKDATNDKYEEVILNNDKWNGPIQLFEYTKLSR